MTSSHDTNGVPFGGTLGDEFRRVWEAIRANQLVPTAGQRVSRTTGGTMVRSSAGRVTSDAERSIRPVVVEKSHNLARIDADGWVESAWVETTSHGNLLFNPLTAETLTAAAAAWGSSARGRYVRPDGYLDYTATGDNWGGLVIPVADYIRAVTPGFWASAMRLEDDFNPANNMMALELSVPLPAATFTDNYSNDIDLPVIHLIEAIPYGQWEAVA